MKINQFYYLALFLCLPFWSNAQKVHTGSEANDRFKNVEMYRDSDHSSIPSFIKFRKSKQIDIDQYKLWMKSNFKLNSAMGFELLSKDTDILGHIHYRYQQTYNGLLIEDAIWLVHTNKDKVYALNGLIFNKLEASPIPTLSESTALEKALDHIGATLYKWQMPGEEKHLKWESGDETATYAPKGEVVFITSNESFNVDSYRLAYKFNIYAHTPISRSDIYVDAISGEIVRQNEIIHHADEEGTAHTAYSGDQTITADSFDGAYRLRDASRGLGVRTYDMNQGTSYGGSVDFVDDDNDWNNINPQKDEYATDAHWGAEMTYDYYSDIHSRNSIDNAGFQLNSYVHYSVSYDNAFWDGSRMTYGDGGSVFTPLTGLDVAGHEVTHGLTSFTAGLIYSAESGALNESFSDIFGSAIERFARPDDWDWLVGEEIGIFGPLRSMSNPNDEGDPDTYFGDFWAPLDGGDSGGVHTNSGVQNFWFYLLTEGGVGTNDNGDDYNVTSIGIEASSAIAFRNLTVYLTPSSNYEDARFYALQSASDLYGLCSDEIEQTGNAWYAVGVGSPYASETQADFSTNDTLGCFLPHEVNFENESSSALTYLWDFGDGETSTEENPVHIYVDAGTYTVTLTADGGDCGEDSFTRVDYIIADPTLDCIIIMPESGTEITQKSCNGTLYDSGGPDTDYGSGENGQITIHPLGSYSVNLEFISFSVEPGSGSSCNYDYLDIFDGPTTSSPLIGRYCNNNLPTDLTSSGEAVTLFFHSDGFVEEFGFEIHWTCNGPEDVPETDFTVNNELSCTGDVYFTDLSTNSPTIWAWDFGDSETSTEQNPSHTYTSEGVYTVSLTATNIVGSNLHTKTSYITVEYPENPTVEGDLACHEESATLSASGSGELNWYDALTGGTLLYTGSAFTTPLLSTTTTYYVEDNQVVGSDYVGAVDNSLGGGGFFSGEQYLLFNNPSPVRLKSVLVYADGEGSRTIELRNSDGDILESVVVFIPDGENTVLLNMDLPVGTDLQLGTAFGSEPALYRNNTGSPDFPFTLDESVMVTNTSAGTDFYYFFYNWEIEPYVCTSDRVPVVAEVVDCLTIDEEDANAISIFPNPTQGFITIQTGTIQTGTILIKDVIGKKIAELNYTNNEITIDLNKYQARGTYFIEILDQENNLITVKKIINQ